MKELITSTIGKVISDKEDGTYKLPCEFYAVTPFKSLENISGENLDVICSDLHFVEYSTGKEVIWEYWDALKFHITDYAYLFKCNDYAIYLYVNTVSDTKVTGFSKEDINIFIK